jgi:glycosyltransferase involved in cell wall biosynthesis
LENFVKNIKKCKKVVDFSGEGTTILKTEEEMKFKNVLETLKGTSRGGEGTESSGSGREEGAVMPFLSVVIPAYKAGKTIGRCVKSLYESIGGISNEVIVVDDNSPDNTSAVVKKLMGKFPTLRLIRLSENIGCGPARNRGLSAARGEFVWFVDGDDEISANGFRGLDVEKACTGHDVLLFRYARVVKGFRQTLPWIKFDRDVIASRPGDIFTAEQFPHVLTMTNAVWNKWFRRESIAAVGLEFPGHCAGEDIGFVSANLCAARSIRFVDRALYVYHEEASQLSRITDDRWIAKEVFEGCERWMHTKKIPTNCWIGYLVTKIHHLLLAGQLTVGISREHVIDNLEDCLQSLGGSTLRALLEHPFLREDIKSRLRAIHSDGGSILCKLIFLCGRVGKYFRRRVPQFSHPRQRLLRPSLAWALAYMIFSTFYLPATPVHGANDLHISGGGGGATPGYSGGTGGAHAGSGASGGGSFGGGGGGAYVGNGEGNASNGSAGNSPAAGGGAGLVGSMPGPLSSANATAANGADNGTSAYVDGGAGGNASYNGAIGEGDGIDSIYITGGGAGHSGSGAGGGGGYASLTATNGDVWAGQNLSLTGGNGGSYYGSSNSSGGNGGYASLMATNVAVTNNLALTGGRGGDYYSNNGHGGGYASLTAINGDVRAGQNLTLTGGGGGGSAGGGGNGGYASLTATNGDVRAGQNLALTGGSGGYQHGGNGGYASLTAINVAADNDLTLTGGKGGDDDGSGTGGYASLTATNVAADNDLTLTGGTGGGDNGGNGGYASLTATNGDVRAGRNLALTGGNGGSNHHDGNNSDGDNGGNASLRATNVTVTNDLALTGGNGGSSYQSRVGGDGGNASLTATNVAVDNNLTLTGGYGYGGYGGYASLTATNGDVRAGQNLALTGGNGSSGGNGGYASLTATNGDVRARQNLALTGGNAYSGDGGYASLTATNVAVTNDLTLTGGNGGLGTGSGVAGVGGYASLTATNVAVDNDLTLTGGTGGGGSSSGGGAGSYASLTATNVAVTNNLTLIGGNGGNTSGGAGGAGSYASLMADGGIVTVGGDVILASGNQGSSNGGAGGKAEFIAGTLKIDGASDHAITLTKNNGELAAKVGNLFLGNGVSVTLTLDGTNTWNDGDGGTGVKFDALTLSTDSTFVQGTANGGTCSDFDTYNVIGIGASYITGPNGLNGFEKSFNFFIPGSAVNDGIMLSVLASAEEPILAPVDITDATIHVGIAGNAFPLKGGDKITLIHGSEVTSGDSINTPEADVMPAITGIQGVSMKYLFRLSSDANNLLANLPGGVGDNATIVVISEQPALLEQTKALLEGSAATTALLNATIDGAADGRVFNSAQNGGTFCSVSGGKSRYTSGSRVNLRDFSALIGAGKAFESPHVKLTSAIFVEGGAGHYKSFNSFPTGEVKGRGDSWCFGGGIFAHLDVNIWEKGHLYGEGSAHGGRIKHDFSTNDMADFLGVKAAYSLRSTYFGCHGGGGYIHEIGEGIFLDAYAKYIWTRKNGKDAPLSTGETVNLKDVDSKRLLSGLKLSRTLSPGTAMYIGGAYHYEFDGEANGSIAGMDIDAPSLHGASAMVELGITGNWNSFSFDLGTHGYLGKRGGFDAFLDIKWPF